MMFALAALVVSGYAAETVYFPKGAEHWYPQYLKAMGEPSLFQEQTNKTSEQYRFLWLRTFHKPIAVRVWKNDSEIKLRVVRLNGAGGYKPGHIERDESFTLTADQWDGFLKLLNKATFWDLPSAENYLGLDGARWILEAQTNGKYHMVDRWSPNYSDGEKRRLENFAACCRYLLALSKEQVPKKDDY